VSLVKESDKIDLNPLSGLQALVSQGDQALLDAKMSSDGIEPQKRTIEEPDSEEELRRKAFYEEEMRREREEQERRFRFQDRKNVEELIGPILSLELVNSFYGQPPDELMLPKIPRSFKSHQEYMQSWMPLFLYETYNQIISSRGASKLDRELSELLGARNFRNDEDKHFSC
jgi:hypothetical protein